MSGLYRDFHETPEDYLWRLHAKFKRGGVRPEDGHIYEFFVTWAENEIAKRQASRPVEIRHSTVPNAATT